MAKKPLKLLRHLIEGFFCYGIYFFFYLLPIDIASSIGGRIAQTVGPFIKASKTAYKNLTLCFPKMGEQEKHDIIKRMWDNLGRILGELPHWASMNDAEFNTRVRFINKTGRHNFHKSIFVSAHMGNFELPARISKSLNLNLGLIYRPANNPFVNRLINSQRLKCGIKLFPKGVAGVKYVCDALRENGNIGLLVDQKTNDSSLVDFFGIPARTSTLPAKLMLKFGAEIVMSRIIRNKGARYTVEFSLLKDINPSDSALEVTEKINQEFERWIRLEPSQWFWVHNRWE